MKLLPVLLAGVLLTTQAHASDVSLPVVSDSRVKTFVYNENEVYTLLTQYGYQSNIEFGKSEEIQTISVGDRIAWQIIPAGHRLFIQTLQEDAQTNMTVVTDRRSYQFDLKSTKVSRGDEDKLVYVARFYYPEEGWDAPMPISVPEQLVPPPASEQYNFSYTYAGPDNAAPMKIFDDGHSTFFQFSGGQQPAITVVTPDGREAPVRLSAQNGYLVAPLVAAQFAVRQGPNIVCVFNEQLHRR